MSSGDEAIIDFLNYKASYVVGIVIGFTLHRYVGSRIFPFQKFQDSERLFWANLLLFCQMMNVIFVFVGFGAYSAKIVPDLIFETLALVLFGFISFGGIDGEINVGLFSLETHPSIIAFGFYFHGIWSLLHIFGIVPSFVPLFCMRSSITFDLYVGYELFVRSYTADCTNSDYQRIN